VSEKRVRRMAPPRGPPRAPEGVEFPLDDENRRSTMKFNAAAFEASVVGVDAEMAKTIAKEAPKWRKRYSKYVIENVKLSAKSEKNALAIANAGLDHLHNNMVFIRNERSMPLRIAMSEFNKDTFATGMVKGKGRMPSAQEFQVPYKNKTLKKDELLVQIDRWAHEGVIEVSCAHALNEVVRSEGWLDLSDVYFVMLGASSAMGPYEFLMNHGANVIAVDIDRPHIWKKLLTIAENSPGTVTFPLKSPVSSKDVSTLAESAGCNLLTQTPEIRNWLLGVHKGKPLGVGCYAYLDGALFVKLSMAMDAISKDLVSSRKNVALAYLCTPTDCHIGTSAASAVATKTYKKSPLWQSLLSAFVSTMPGLKSLKRNAFRHVETDDGNTLHCVDAIVPEQGPNYILAKRLQHWRAIVSRDKGCIVSSNIAPSTRTLSVVHNIQFKMAYGGMGHFRPMEVFDQETSSAVMAGLLVYDLKCSASAAHPSTELANPLCLFSENSFHGGAWRCGYKFSSIGTSAVLVYLLTNVLVPFYLFLYNTVQFMGWSYVAWITLNLFKAADWDVQAVMQQSPWDAVALPLRFFQDLAFMEVLHCMLRFTPSSWFTTLIQIMSRVLLVEGLAVTPEAQNNVFIYGLLFAWGITEIVRYSYYALKLAGLKISLLTWLRYSLFLVLYPTGVLSELFCLRKVVYFFSMWKGENWLTTSTFVEKLGVENSKFLVFILYCGLYVPFFPMLFGLMLRQRKKILAQSPRNKIKTN
jgi:hypothetical protein